MLVMTWRRIATERPGLTQFAVEIIDEGGREFGQPDVANVGLNMNFKMLPSLTDRTEFEPVGLTLVEP